MEKYFTEFKKLNKFELLDSIYIAVMYDRIKREKGLPLMYGTQFYKKMENVNFGKLVLKKKLIT